MEIGFSKSLNEHDRALLLAASIFIEFLLYNHGFKYDSWFKEIFI